MNRHREHKRDERLHDQYDVHKSITAAFRKCLNRPNCLSLHQNREETRDTGRQGMPPGMTKHQAFFLGLRTTGLAIVVLLVESPAKGGDGLDLLIW